jgi:AAA15 family ATPase/GTPase
MILRKIDYHEFDGEPNYWALKDLTLERINLLVGKNATGKTNTITKITWLGNMLAGTQHPNMFTSCDFDVEFADTDDVYKYHLTISSGKVDFEKLEINNEAKIIRNRGGRGEIYADELNRKMNFQLSSNQLAVVLKRDAIQHPFLEKIFKWADGLRFYEFGTSLGKDTFMLTNNKDNIIVNPKDANSVVGFFMKGNHDFPNDFQKKILSYMGDIGYELSEVGTVTNKNLLLQIIPGGPIPMTPDSLPFMIYAEEKDSKLTISQQLMSQGMFRAFSLLIQIVYNILSDSSLTILIDDIGEGLDFDRSSRLIKLLIEIAEKNENIQLIMSTNDRYVMNAVPLEYWQVIQRKGGECQVFNYRNSKEKFDEFEYMGLSNFDFLRTDFINSQWENV